MGASFIQVAASSLMVLCLALVLLKVVVDCGLPFHVFRRQLRGEGGGVSMVLPLFEVVPMAVAIGAAWLAGTRGWLSPESLAIWGFSVIAASYAVVVLLITVFGPLTWRWIARLFEGSAARLFHNLAPAEAEAALRDFCKVEQVRAQKMIAAAAQDGVVADFSMGSLAPVLEWLGHLHRRRRMGPSANVPAWLRSDGLNVGAGLWRNEPSEVLVRQAAYYLGETFVRSGRGLVWASGDTRSLDVNKPVVHGFARGAELSPLRLARAIVPAARRRNARRRILRLLSGWMNDAASRGDGGPAVGPAAWPRG